MSVLSACPDLTFDSGLIAAAVVFCVGSSILFREGPFFRPHPIVWKLALAVAIMYELVLVFLLFQVCAACKKSRFAESVCRTWIGFDIYCPSLIPSWVYRYRTSRMRFIAKSIRRHSTYEARRTRTSILTFVRTKWMSSSWRTCSAGGRRPFCSAITGFVGLFRSCLKSWNTRCSIICPTLQSAGGIMYVDLPCFPISCTIS